MIDILDKDKLVGTCRRLPIQLDAERLQEEIDSISQELWGEHRAEVHNDVSAVFLKGFPPIQRKPDDDRPVLNTLPYIRESIYKTIPGNPAKCVVAKLRPGGQVLMHRDGYIDDLERDDRYFYDYFYSTIRIHIPVVTSKEALFFCNGEFFHMPAGEVWLVNNISDHAVLNENPVLERTHIIVDMHPDDELMRMVENAGNGGGWKDRDLLARIMETSCSPEVSIYAQGKPLPADY